MNILGTGFSGLVGARVSELLADSFSFENLSLETGVDITDRNVVEQKIGSSDAPWVFHFAAKTDVDGCEKEKNQGKNSGTWKINVEGTESIVRACKKNNKKLLYLSTDFVFDGKKESYDESDTPNPLGFYAITKYEGEKLVQSLGSEALIVRISYPYCARPVRPDFVAKILDRLNRNLITTSLDDQLIVPTFIDDIAKALAMLVGSNADGIYHVVGSQALTPYDVSQKIAETFNLPTKLISSTKMAIYFANRAPRPLHAILKNDKISKLGLVMSSFDEGLQKIRIQLKR